MTTAVHLATYDAEMPRPLTVGDELHCPHCNNGIRSSRRMRREHPTRGTCCRGTVATPATTRERLAARPGTRRGGQVVATVCVCNGAMAASRNPGRSWT